MDIMKTKKPKTNPLDTSTKEGAQNMLERLMAGRRMRGGTDGFRAYSTKAGPIRQMTIEDRLQLRMFGTKALPRAVRRRSAVIPWPLQGVSRHVPTRHARVVRRARPEQPSLSDR